MSDGNTNTEESVRPPPKRHWLKVGCELEGSWSTNHRDVASLVPGAIGKGDASVGRDGARLPGFPGEIITRPHETLDGLSEDLTKLWPQHSNYTCGFHVHVSFNNIDTSRLADKPLWEYFLKRWEAWGKANELKMTKEDKTLFWDRLEAKSESARKYCKREFIPLEQFENHEMRYTAINFVAWSKYRTIEVRFLPMFTKPELASLAVRELIDIFDSYLTNTPFPEIKIEEEVKTIGEEVLEAKELIMPETSFYEESYPLPDHKKVMCGPDVFYHIKGAEGLMVLPDTPSSDIHEA